MFKDRVVVCFGIGKNFYSYVSRLDTCINVQYFCDSNVSYQGITPLKDGRICISPMDLKKIDDPVVIVTCDKETSCKEIKDWLDKEGIENYSILNILDRIAYKVETDWIGRLQENRIHKFIDLNLHGITTCNFHCDYCYVWRRNEFQNTNILSEHSVKEIRNGLSLQKTGGICFINMCARGETLVSKDVVDLAYELLDEGHYVSVVTNGTVTENIRKILTFPEEFQSRFFFKLSFHFLELEKKKLFDLFWRNVGEIKKSNCSYTLEITPYDGLVNKIPEIKKMFKEKADGAMPHISYARDSKKADYDILSDYSLEDYNSVWGQFDSKMFELKNRHYGQKVTEFCHAGEWSYLVSILTGEVKACYRQEVIGNIYDADFKEFPSRPVRHDCHMAYCINNHAFMAWGTVPEIKEYTYLEMRDRVDNTGESWVKNPMKSFMSDKLYDTNYVYEDNWNDYERLFSEREKPAFLIFNSPDYMNTGDIAIALGERSFINKYFPQYDVIEISCTQYQKEKYKLISKIRENDIIAITGGGNIGSLWLRFEDYVLDIIQTFDNNKIVVFPQSIYFSENSSGMIEKETFKNAISNHQNLLLTVRDRASYLRVKEMFKDNINILIIPDMAMCLPNIKKSKKGKKILICLRNDKEGVNREKKEIIDKLNSVYDGQVEVIDSLPTMSVKQKDRRKTLNKAISIVSSKQFVITDRLHCMLLCVLTETPCIAIDNISKKISGAYDWIGNCKFVALYDDNIDIVKKIQEICNEKYSDKIEFELIYRDYAKAIKRELKL